MLRKETRIDLHLHSTVSDGTDSPAELLERVQAAGVGVFSLTDHDAIRGCAEIQALLGPESPHFLSLNLSPIRRKKAYRAPAFRKPDISMESRRRHNGIRRPASVRHR